MENKTAPQWYDKEWKLILICISIPILGLWGIWKAEKIAKMWKIIFAILASFMSFRLIMFMINDFKTYLIYLAIVAAIFIYVTVAEHSKPVLYGLIFFTALGLTLPFHYVMSRDMPMVLKENITFKNTIVTEDDVNEIIDRYNHASFIERVSIESEPLVKKLKQLKILVPKEEKTEEEKNY